MFLISCAQESKITPIAKAKKLGGENLTLNLKYPLFNDNEDMKDFGKWDWHEGEKGFLKNFGDIFVKYPLGNLAIQFKILDYMRYSIDIELPDLDFKEIKSIKIKKVFFTLLPCADTIDEDCEDIREEDANFGFLENFAINISPILPGADISDLYDLDTKIRKKDFNKVFSQKIDNKKLLQGFNLPKNFNKKELVKGINLVRFENQSSTFWDKFFKNSGVRKKFHDQKRFYQFHSTPNYMKIKRFLEDNAEFKDVVKDITLMGDTVLVELEKNELDKDHERVAMQFFNGLRKTKFHETGFYTFENNLPKMPSPCSLRNCVMLDVNNDKLVNDVNDMNLMHLFRISNRLKLDNFFGIRKVPGSDFRYKGFLEIEVKLDLPL